MLQETWMEGTNRAFIRTTEAGHLRSYELSTTAKLRDNQPADKRVEIKEVADHATVRSGNVLFDGLYALAVQEAIQNSVNQIKDYAYNHDQPIRLKAFQTGIVWTYVWTRDSAYSCRLALGGFDPERAMTSLLFKTSVLKPSVTGGFQHQIIQDTGSGGSYPISSDRIVWILGADATLKFLPEPRQKEFLSKVYQILHDTLEEDRRLIFDPADGLYRGEQSFLDWREQTYPMWTKDNVMAIGMSKALSVNAADYFALVTASKYAGKLGYHDDEARYAKWAKALKKAIHK
ncbi:MAG TPA: hypothetical protein VKA67_03155, partial [Verrucomicrobiae bacterium]|nr:hypothetical protein [Verrucomicrobiae bacterium]